MNPPPELPRTRIRIVPRVGLVNKFLWKIEKEQGFSLPKWIVLNDSLDGHHFVGIRTMGKCSSTEKAEEVARKNFSKICKRLEGWRKEYDEWCARIMIVEVGCNDS